VFKRRFKMPVPKVITEEIDAKIVEYREADRSCNWIAQRLGIPVATIYSHCLTYGIESPRTRTKAKLSNYKAAQYMRGDQVVRRFSAEEDQRLLALRLEGKTCSQIGRELGRGAGSIKRRLCTLARYDARKDEVLSR